MLFSFSINNSTANLNINDKTTAELVSILGPSASQAIAISQYSQSSPSWRILLNTDFLSNASQEFIAAVFLHELVHIQLTKDGVPFVGQTGQHLSFFNNDSKYIEAIKNELKAQYMVSENDAIALALSGLKGTDTANQNEIDSKAMLKYNMTYAQATVTANQYLVRSKGTQKCQ